MLSLIVFLYFEAQCLAGYRNPPFPGFDLMQEAEHLTDPGTKDHDVLSSFEELADEVLRYPAAVVESLTLKEYIATYKWLTAGSSSEGVIHWSTPLEKGKIKCRKNLVIDILDTDALYSLAIGTESQRNTVLIKSELGKIRLAVASDLGTYLLMAWMIYHCGGAYLNWPNTTLKESIDEQSDRIICVLKELATTWGLSYDFKAFDHQPQTSEIVCVWKLMSDIARTNIPNKNYFEWEHIRDTVTKGFYTATLKAREGQQSKIWHVVGGLMSGLFITSIFGNAWNAVISEASLRWVKYWTKIAVQPYRMIRGDDTVMLHASPYILQLISKGFDATGAEAGRGKFSIREHECEFLRVWYSDRCYGYPNRALPGLTQRKPWSSQPWSENEVILAIADTCQTLERRGVKTTLAWQAFARRWAQLNRKPVALLSVPKAFGGIGASVDEGWRIVKKTSAVEVKKKDAMQSLTLERKTNTREISIEEQATRLGISLTHDQRKLVADNQQKDVIVSDDVPGISSYIRRQIRDSYKAARYRLRRQNAPEAVWARFGGELHVGLPLQQGIIKLARDINKRDTPGFGTFSHDVQDILSAKPMLQVTGVSLREYIRSRYPKIDYFIRSHRSKLSDTLDYLGGTFSTTTKLLHPQLKNLLTSELAFRCRGLPLRKRLWADAMCRLSFSIEQQLCLQPVVQRAYMW